MSIPSHTCTHTHTPDHVVWLIITSFSSLLIMCIISASSPVLPWYIYTKIYFVPFKMALVEVKNLIWLSNWHLGLIVKKQRDNHSLWSILYLNICFKDSSSAWELLLVACLRVTVSSGQENLWYYMWSLLHAKYAFYELNSVSSLGPTSCSI